MKKLLNVVVGLLAINITLANVTLSFGNISDNQIEVVADNSNDAIAGFQFVVSANNGNFEVTGASGGSSEEAGMSISTSSSGTVLGFSLTGASIPAGAGVLTVLDVSHSGSPSTVCLSGAVISDPGASGLGVEYGDCIEFPPPLPPATLSFGEGDMGTVEVLIESETDIAGFQFDLSDAPDAVDVTSATGGIAEAVGFNVSTSGTTVLGFSLTGATIPAGSHVLTLLTYSFPTGDTEACLDNAVLSSTDGTSIPALYGDCLDIVVPPVTLSFGNVSGSSVDILMDTPYDVAGFQFDVDDSPDVLSIAGVGGGEAEAAGFSVSNSSSTVIGFSLTGATISAGDYTLTTITLDPIAATTLCLDGAILSSPSGNSLPIAYGDCLDYPPVTLSIGNVTGDGLEIIMDNPLSVAGFQFDVSYDASAINLSGAGGGSAEAAGFSVSTSATTVIGFSLTGASIDAGNGVLLLLAFDGFGESEICLGNAIVSDPSGNGASVQYGDCVVASFNKPEVSIDSPADGAIVVANSLEVSVSSANLSEGDHYHAYIDGEMTGMYYTDTFSIDVSPGEHTLTVVVADASHTLYENEEATATASFNFANPGDVNQDGNLNVLDIVSTVNYILGAISPTDVQFAAADNNSDGLLNVLDIVLIVNLILG